MFLKEFKNLSEIVKAAAQLKEGIQPTVKVQGDLKKYVAEHLSKYENPKLWEFKETFRKFFQKNYNFVIRTY